MPQELSIGCYECCSILPLLRAVRLSVLLFSGFDDDLPSPRVQTPVMPSALSMYYQTAVLTMSLDHTWARCVRSDCRTVSGWLAAGRAAAGYGGAAKGTRGSPRDAALSAVYVTFLPSGGRCSTASCELFGCAGVTVVARISRTESARRFVTCLKLRTRAALRKWPSSMYVD